MTARAQGLPTRERLKQRPQFERAYDQGIRVSGRFMTLFVVPNQGTTPRFGVAASRKIGNAVIRNRAKRLARELFRRQKPAAGIDLVIVPRRDMVNVPFASLETDYHAALDRRDRPQPSAGHVSRRQGGRRAPARV